MEQSIKSIREEYSKQLALNGNIDRAKEIINQDIFLPVLKPIEIHAESEIGQDDFNSIFKDIDVDLNIINNNITQAANNYKNLLKVTKLKLDNIKTTLKTEKERQEDINILCNKYTDFSNAILISNSNSVTDLENIKGALALKSASSKQVNGVITKVSGNGYEGNAYVYKNGSFANEVSNSSIKDYATDNSLMTYYEYSRITANNTEPEVFPLVNFDSIYARCSILIQGSELFNTLEISTDNEDVILESLSTSLDGQTFTESSLHDIAISNKRARFDTDDYIYGCGILSFKDSMYVKLVLRANKNTNESIAFNKKNVDGTNTIVHLKSAKRSVIKINNITLGRKEYETKCNLIFDKFITDSVNSVAIFANEYISDGYDIRQCVKYTLTVNGLDYDIIPINSNNNGKKIIRTTSKAIPAEHVHYLNENIKDATLTINVKTPNNTTTPYISDLKILIGGE